MIRHAEGTANAWTPDGFNDFLNYYPATHWDTVPEPLDLNPAFAAVWNQPGSIQTNHDIAIALTPGLFAEWLPGCFRAAYNAFRHAGHRVLKSRVRSNLNVLEQSAVVGAEVSSWLHTNEYFIWCGHSKGGLELLHALETHPNLRARCIAAIVVQPPVGTSPVLQHFSSDKASVGQRLSKRLLGTRFFSRGVSDISADRDPDLERWLSHFRSSVPTINVVSWSVEPTNWIDSWHRTLGKVRPGIAHDGQFLTHEQLLPELPVVALPRLDHAQPVLGGNAFNVARFWQTLVVVATNLAMQAGST